MKEQTNIEDIIDLVQNDVLNAQMPFDDYFFNLDDVSQKNANNFPKRTVLYCLMKDEERELKGFNTTIKMRIPVYIGQSINVFNRLKAHRSKLQNKWDSVCMMKVNPKHKLQLERFFIKRYAPLENKRISQITLNDLRIAEQFI
jgi:hypothetical protein